MSLSLATLPGVGKRRRSLLLEVSMNKLLSSICLLALLVGACGKPQTWTTTKRTFANGVVARETAPGLNPALQQPVVVFVHGLGYSGGADGSPPGYFENLAKKVQLNFGYATVEVDMPGAGASKGLAPCGTVTLQSQAAALSRVIFELRRTYAKIIVIGHSAGAAAALLAKTTNPGAIDSYAALQFSPRSPPPSLDPAVVSQLKLGSGECINYSQVIYRQAANGVPAINARQAFFFAGAATPVASYAVDAQMEEQVDTTYLGSLLAAFQTPEQTYKLPQLNCMPDNCLFQMAQYDAIFLPVDVLKPGVTNYTLLGSGHSAELHEGRILQDSHQQLFGWLSRQ